MSNRAQTVAAETLIQLAQHYAGKFATRGATPEQAVAVLEANWGKVIEDATKLHGAVLDQMSER
jgi:hypothetical protein